MFETTVSKYNQWIKQLASDASYPVERKGKTVPYTSVNGHMFSFVGKKGELGIRLSKAERDGFLEKFPDAIIEQHGRVMKDYIELPESYFSNNDAVIALLKKSYDYVSSLKPKPTSKKK